MSNENKFKEAMLLLATTYEKELNPEQVKIYWSVLGKHNSDHVIRSVKDHVSDPNLGLWFPRPAHLINWINKYIMADNQKKEINQSMLIEHKQSSEEQKQKALEVLKGLKA